MDLALKFSKNLPMIIEGIITGIKQLIKENELNFNKWINVSADFDFMYTYEISFKRYLLEHFSIETERILSYYSQNLCYALSTNYEMYHDLNAISHFVDIFIKKQFEDVDQDQLFMESS